MAFTVEDGTGLADANSFASVAFADAYFSERGITTWTGSDTAKEQALVRATDYVANRFTWRLAPYSDEQALPFPTVDPCSSNPAEMPAKLLKATSEYALRGLDGTPLAPDLVFDDSGNKIVEKTEKVGPLEEHTKFQDGGATKLFRPYPAADMLLRGLVVSGNRTFR